MQMIPSILIYTLISYFSLLLFNYLLCYFCSIRFDLVRFSYYFVEDLKSELKLKHFQLLFLHSLAQL